MQNAFRIYRTRFVRVAGTAIVIFAITGAVEVAIHLAEEQAHLNGDHGALLPIAIAGLLATVLSTIGAVFYAGILEMEVGAELEGQNSPTMRQILRRLPFWKLILADVLFFAMAIVGLIFFVIPGLVAVVTFSIVGPLIIIEGHGVTSAFRHSARLVWGSFGLAAVVILPAVLIEEIASSQASTLSNAVGTWAGFVYEVLLGMTLGAVVGLFEVVLARTLIHHDRESGDSA